MKPTWIQGKGMETSIFHGRSGRDVAAQFCNHCHTDCGDLVLPLHLCVDFCDFPHLIWQHGRHGSHLHSYLSRLLPCEHSGSHSLVLPLCVRTRTCARVCTSPAPPVFVVPSCYFAVLFPSTSFFPVDSISSLCCLSNKTVPSTALE